jgi:hypothetical protein
MIGFVTTKEQAAAANAAIAMAQTSRGLPVFWLAGSYPIYSGQHAGSYFIPCDDATLSTPLIGSPPQTPQDFPEYAAIIEAMGGLDARVEIEASAVADLTAEELTTLSP